MLQKLLHRKDMLLFLALANGLGSLYGYYWYQQQLLESPWYFWPVIPDSPLSATLFSIFLLAWLRQKHIPWLFLLANLMMIKYGIWAVLINLDVYTSGHTFTWENLHLSLSHAIMALQGFIFIRQIRYSFLDYWITATWLILNDLCDYLLETHPYLFYSGQLVLAQNAALTLTVLVLILAGGRLKAVQ